MSAGAHPAAAVRSRLGLALIASITILWGFNWPVLKIAVSEMPVFTFRSISLASGIIGMFFLCWIEKKPIWLPRRDVLPCFLVAMATITGWNLASTLGLQHMAPGRASILAFTMPLWAALMAVPMLHEKMTRLRLLGLVLGLAGMALLIWPDRASLVLDPLGPIYMIGAAITWALGTVGLKMHRWSVPLTTITAWQFAFGTLPVVIGALIADRDVSFAAVDLRGWSAVFYASIVCTVYCYWAWFRIVEIYPATVAAIATLGIPVVGVFSSAAVLGESVGLSEIGALALVVSALVVVLILPGLSQRNLVARGK